MDSIVPSNSSTEGEPGLPTRYKNLEDLAKKASEIEKLLTEVLNEKKEEELSRRDRLYFELFIAYGLNCLFWMYLRLKGINPNEHRIKQEVGKVKGAMVQSQSSIDRLTLRKSLNVTVAQRFIKRGINFPSSREDSGDADYPTPKKTKLESSDEDIDPNRKKNKFETSDEDVDPTCKKIKLE